MKEVPNKTVADKVLFETRSSAQKMGANFGQEYMLVHEFFQIHEFFQNMYLLDFLQAISDAIEERLEDFKKEL